MEWRGHRFCITVSHQSDPNIESFVGSLFTRLEKGKFFCTRLSQDKTTETDCFQYAVLALERPSHIF